VVGPLVGGVTSYDDARPFAEGSTNYITAAWGQLDIANELVPNEIIIGDGKEYIVDFSGTTVDYQNVRLDPGVEYNFFTRYDIENEDENSQVK